MNTPDTASFFIRFQQELSDLRLPDRFTFPFYYEPHPIAVLAATELQTYIQEKANWEHNFGLDTDPSGLVIGKMFGVLVVQNEQQELGYLAAFSGKLAGVNHHPHFVPPVFDMLEEFGFFREGEKIISAINEQIDQLEQHPDYLALLALQQHERANGARELQQIKADIKAGKARRKGLRSLLSPDQHGEQLEQLRLESIREQYYLKDRIEHWRQQHQAMTERVAVWTNRIDALKQARRDKSAALQQRIFSEYAFLNKHGELKSLQAIFENTVDKRPPAGAGECAAPKLLHFAYKHGFHPIALAEFWWGESPKSEIRKHTQFYPACRGKCEPILSHMLVGLEVDPNPMLENPADGKELSILFEDDHIIVINKPAEFLSVPGKNISDSVYERMRARYPNAGPLIVHRLDMSTSGIMVLAKNKEAHEKLQRQFTRRHVQKRYTALLDGTISEASGEIKLPLRVDLDDRPRQLVDFVHGKHAWTRWEKVSEINGKTRVYFYPITGRTHQLRVHASHPDGLNAAIVGDDLYGTRSNRLHLHAGKLTFNHPSTNQELTFEVEASF